MLIFIKIVLSCATVIAGFLLIGYLAQKLDPGFIATDKDLWVARIVWIVLSIVIVGLVVSVIWLFWNRVPWLA
jgi:hypothetical protein